MTGVTQTARNFGASLGMAVLGTILILRNEANIEASLESAGLSAERAKRVADAVSHAGDGSQNEFSQRAGAGAKKIFEAVQHDFALSTRTVFYVMAGAFVLAFIVAALWMPGGKVAEPVLAEPPPRS